MGSPTCLKISYFSPFIKSIFYDSGAIYILTCTTNEENRITSTYCCVCKNTEFPDIRKKLILGLNLPNGAKRISCSGCPSVCLNIQNFHLIIFLRPTASNSQNIVLDVAKSCTLMPIFWVWKIGRGFTIITERRMKDWLQIWYNIYLKHFCSEPLPKQKTTLSSGNVNVPQAPYAKPNCRSAILSKTQPFILLICKYIMSSHFK